MDYKPYESWEFCKAIDCDALRLTEDNRKFVSCHKCYAYKMHQYLQDHGQILDQEHMDRARQLEADCAAIREAAKELKTITENREKASQVFAEWLKWRDKQMLAERALWQALALSAGKDLLERVQRLEAVTEAAKKRFQYMQEYCWCNDCQQCDEYKKATDEYYAALATLEGGSHEQTD